MIIYYIIVIIIYYVYHNIKCILKSLKKQLNIISPIGIIVRPINYWNTRSALICNCSFNFSFIKYYSNLFLYYYDISLWFMLDKNFQFLHWEPRKFEKFGPSYDLRRIIFLPKLSCTCYAYRHNEPSAFWMTMYATVFIDDRHLHDSRVSFRFFAYVSRFFKISTGLTATLTV